MTITKNYYWSMEKIKHKRSEIQSIIEKRRDWLNENHIQDWNDTDTYEVMKEYANLFASPVSLDTHTAEEQKSATQVLYENGIYLHELNDEFNTSMLHSMTEYASQESLKARQEAIEKVEKLLNLYWTFDQHQIHSHSWHAKQDFFKELEKLKSDSTKPPYEK